MRPLHHAIQAFRYFNLVAFIALGAVTLVFWLRRRDRASRWAAVAFGALGLLELLTLVPNHPGNLPERAVGRVAIVLIVVFPYLLFRFTNAFRTPKRRLANGLVVLTVVLVAWNDPPGGGAPAPAPAAGPAPPRPAPGWKRWLRAILGV